MDKSKFNVKSEWKKFAIGLSIILAAIATVQLITGNSLYVYFFASSLIILIIGITVPIVIKPLFIIFSYLGLVLGWIMTRVILIILFIAVVTPIGLIAKLFRKKFLDTKFGTNQDSYWIETELEPSLKDSYKRQF